MALNRLALDAGLFWGLSAVEIDALMLRLNGVSVSEGDSKGRGTPQGGVISPLLSKDSTPWVRFFLVETKSCFHAGDFVARRGAIASICRRARIGRALRVAMPPAERFNTFESHPGAGDSCLSYVLPINKYGIILFTDSK